MRIMIGSFVGLSARREQTAYRWKYKAKNQIA